MRSLRFARVLVEREHGRDLMTWACTEPSYSATSESSATGDTQCLRWLPEAVWVYDAFGPDRTCDVDRLIVSGVARLTASSGALGALPQRCLSDCVSAHFRLLAFRLATSLGQPGAAWHHLSESYRRGRRRLMRRLRAEARQGSGQRFRARSAGPDITWSSDARAEPGPALSEPDDHCGPPQRHGDDDD
jgi:hypothetical protein